MNTLRRLIFREVAWAVAYVTLGFWALFFLFDLIDELRWVRSGPGGYTMAHALLSVGLRLPNYLYELLPITVLIGTIYVMAGLANSSEFTIMRTSGMGPGRALRTLLALGGMFVVITFALGDYVVPLADRAGQLLRARQLGQLTSGATGGWLKEHRDGHALAVNVRALGPEGQLRDIRPAPGGAHFSLRISGVDQRLSAPKRPRRSGFRTRYRPARPFCPAARGRQPLPAGTHPAWENAGGR